jgi:CDP-glycerol glycerophosphotransferase (TagB/SpsB family)
MGERGIEVIPGRKVLLYAPTFRGTVRDASSPDKLDIQLLKRKFGKDHILLINHHPFVKEKDRPVIPVQCRDFAFDLTGRVSIEELLTAADICITDYSSLVFEYALFERPLIFFAYDMEAYLDERGFYYPIREMMPGPVCRTNEDVIEAVGRAGAEFDLQRVRAFKYRFMSSCDGHATQRLLRLMDRCADEKQQT